MYIFFILITILDAIEYQLHTSIKVLLAPDHYCKREWRWTLLWGIILFDVAQNTGYTERHISSLDSMLAGSDWQVGYPSAAAGGVKTDFMIFLEVEWGTGPLRANTNYRILVNNIKHSKRHKMALGHIIKYVHNGLSCNLFSDFLKLIS